MTADIIPLPSERRQAILDALGTRPVPAAFLDIVSKFSQENWGITALEKLIPSVAWIEDPKSVDLFAKILSRYCIEFNDRLRNTASLSACDGTSPSDTERNAAASLMKAFEDLSEKRRSLAFTRALPIATLLDDALEEASPVRVIEKHMHDVFRSDHAVQINRPMPLTDSEPLYLLFMAIGDALSKAYPKDPRARAVSYFLTSPHRDAGGVTASLLRKLVQLEFPYRRLLFLRYTAPVYERLDPMPERWSDLKWLFDFAETPWEMERVVNACFELIDQAADLFRDPDGIVAMTVNEFFAKVRRAQGSLGGRSFWDEDTATYKVYAYFRQHAYLEHVRPDFHSHLCWMAQEEHGIGEPGFEEWDTVVREALDEGYVPLAQALTAYKLIEEVILLDRITDWPAFTRLNRALRSESNYELLATAIQFSAQVWKQRGRAALAERLEAQAPSKASTTEDRVLHVIEGAARIGKEEIELRLIEHIDRNNWDKLASASRNWLIEADMDWSDFKFRSHKDHDRTDWSAPAVLFCKAIEHELIIRYANACRQASDWNKERDNAVSLGQVVRFLRMAANGDSEKSAILESLELASLPSKMLEQLARLTKEYRNPASHGNEPFTESQLDNLRWELFGDRLLRDLLENLPSIAGERAS